MNEGASMKRSKRMSVHVLAIALAGAGGLAFAQDTAQDTMTAPQVRAALEAQGYTDIDDVEFDDGMWEADATSADGKRVDVRIDPRTSQVYPEDQVSSLGEADIRARLAAAGYSNVHDVEFDDGLWKAEADAPHGGEVDLRMDPNTGDIVAEDRD